MRMLAVFGQLLQNVGEKLKRQADASGTKVTGPVPTTETTEITTSEPSKILIWGIVDGPYSIDDFPEEELEYLDIEEGYEWMLVCKIEEDGAIGLANFWYPSLDDALQVKYYFDNNIEPLELQQ
jgi:hypothetical protein